MSNGNIAQAKAIERKNKAKILECNNKINDHSGIYFLTRKDENGIGYFYIGQAKHVLTRLAQHMTGYQHIDLSIRKRGFYSESNIYGWHINVISYPESELDKWEQYWILEYTKRGYQCRYNKTSGGQGEGKVQINEYRPAKGYRDGIIQGRKSLAKELGHIIDKHLVVSIKPEKAHNKVSQQAYEKFMGLLDPEENGDGR